MARAARTALVLLSLAATIVGEEVDQSPESRRLQNLETLAEVWGRVYLFHPGIVSEGLDWEKALVNAIPEIEAAKSDEELITRLQRTLLAQISDPGIRVFRKNATEEDNEKGSITARAIAPGVGLIAVSHPNVTAQPNFPEDFANAYRGLGDIQKLIVDLRWPGRLPSPDAREAAILRFFISSPAIVGDSVQRQHSGWSERQDPNVYRQNWIVLGGERFFPINQRAPGDRAFPDTKLEALPIIKVPTLFLINNHSHFVLSEKLDMLQHESGAAVAWEQRGETPRISWLNAVSIGKDHEIYIPDQMMLNAGGSLGFRPDFETATEIRESDLLRLTTELLPARPRNQARFGFGMKFPERAEPSDTLSREQRIAGLIKLWTVVNHFDPHLEFAGRDWESALHTGIPAVENAAAVRDYYWQLGRLTAPLNDNHVTVYHRSLFAGRALPPVQLHPVDGRVFVTLLAKGVAADIKPGDEIVAVDGKPIKEIEQYWRAVTSLSTPATLARNLWTWGTALLGKADTAVRFTVERDQKRRVVEMRRVENPEYPKTVSFRRLNASLGYINLCELANVAELDLALGELADTRGLILDIREYPRFWITRALTERLIEKPVRSTKFVIPIVTSPDPLRTTLSTEQYLVEPHPTIRYTRPVVVLIDENTQSMAEDFCIYLRNARRVTFVGSQTAGTNGNIARIELPGGGRMTFTGMRVLYDDGSRFQNIGIVPDVPVRPTAAGVRAGRDEVLEKAVEVLEAVTGSPD